MYNYWASLIIAVVISSFSQMLLKKSATKNYDTKIREYLNIYVISGYFLLVVSTFCVIYAYRGIEYKNGAVIESLSYLLVMIMSHIFFHEKITNSLLAGNIVILLGIIIFYL